LPALHGVQAAVLSVSVIVPAPHGVQVRSEIEVPSVSTRVPAAHEAWSMQYVLPASSWNWLALHGVQLTALAVPAKLPAEQSTHRVRVELALSASYVPGLHGCFVSQYGWPSASWYLPSGHAVQIKLAFENSSIKQPMQITL
jgi:hypothetical protein